MTKKKPKKTLTVKQQRLIDQLPQIASGKKSKAKAMRDAGYSKLMSLQQSDVLGSPRIQSAMQEALRKAGVTEERVAEKVGKGMNNPIPQVGLGYTKLAAELLDAFPAKKIDVKDVTPLSYGDLEDKPKAKTVEQARQLAEAKDEWDDGEDE